jgi:hypothetical protein
MPPSASPSRFGRPQIYALLLLAAFAAQCIWLIAARPLDNEEQWYIARGLRLLEHHDVPADNAHSPLIYLIAAIPAKLAGSIVPANDDVRRWITRFSFLFFGLLRGASLWYVARRLYGNAGGYFSLALYCFSPRMVQEGSHIWPDVIAGWGFFGAIFTAIAMSHTLYALPGTLPWPRRWKRTILMGIGLGLGVASQFSVVIAVPLALLFMLYLVPQRRAEALGMLALGCSLAAGILFATYGFSASAFAATMVTALIWAPITPIAARCHTLADIFRDTNIALLAMLVAALVTWTLWRRARYFGNTAPLIVAVAVVMFAPLFPGDDPWRLWIPSVAFVFMFIGGVFADLLETRRSRLVMALGVGLLLVNIALGLQRTVS